MMLRQQKIVIDGKRISNSKFELMLQEGLENVILSGFFTVEDLSKVVAVNGYYSPFMIDKLLDKLYNEYSSTLASNRKRALYDKAAASNVIVISSKLKLILDLMENRSQDTIKTIIENESEYYDYDQDKATDDDFFDSEDDVEEDRKAVSNLITTPLKVM